MTVGVLCLDGLDWRLADDVGLFDATPLSGQELTNDLTDHDRDLFTPRVWTHVFAGQYQDAVAGWMPGDDWADATSDLVFLWDRFPGTRVHDLRVHQDGLTKSDVFLDNWAAVATTYDDQKHTAATRATMWNQDLKNDPPVIASWFGFPDRYGHEALKREDALRPAYTWMRDELLPSLDVPDELVVLSDHGFQIDTEAGGPHAGMDAHRRPGVLAATDGVDGLLDYDALSTFIPNWQGDLASILRDQRLQDLGYQ